MNEEIQLRNFSSNNTSVNGYKTKKSNEIIYVQLEFKSKNGKLNIETYAILGNRSAELADQRSRFPVGGK